MCIEEKRIFLKKIITYNHVFQNAATRKPKVETLGCIFKRNAAIGFIL